MSSPGFVRLLRRGDQGADVVAVKRALIRWLGDGRPHGIRLTDTFGAAAVAELERFQQHEKLHVDGVYGPATHAKLAPFFDAYGRSLLEKTAKELDTPGARALAFAKTQLGVHEDPPGSNMTKFGAWYGWNGVRWCAIFESYCFGHTGRPGFHYASVEQIYEDARAGRNGLTLTGTPRHGDLALIEVGGDPFAHTSFFDAWIDEAAGTFWDLGGNTGPASTNDGGEVARQVRSRAIVSHWVHAA